MKDFILKYKFYLIPGSLIIVGLIIWLLAGEGGVESDVARCEKGLFETTVSTVGQIEATSTIDISIPDILRNRQVRIWGVNIIDLVAEGTKVKKGDYVASLDPAEVDSELKIYVDRLDQNKSQYESARLDSSLRMSGYRDAILTAKDQLADAKIKVDQSVYESKAYQRQAQIELERAQRNLEQKKRELTRQEMKMKVDINRKVEEMKYNETMVNSLKELKSQLKITAPANGMVIYNKNPWRGNQKFKVGDEVNRHIPNFASLPDLSSLVSVAFIQEVDIKNVSEGQKVRIQIDAFPGKEFTGQIKKIANIGQQLSGKQMNGFKVDIVLDPYSEELFPNMTTNNQIVTGTWEDALMVPRPAVFGNDSIRYVYLKDGFNVIKQQVETGGENETQFRIEKGLNKGDKVLLMEPANSGLMELIPLSND